MTIETIARKLSTTWKQILTTIATLIFTGWGLWLLVKFVMEFRLRDLIGVAIVIAVVSLLAVFMVYSKRAARVIESGFKAYFLFLGWALAALVPVSLFYWLSPLIISSSRVWLQVVAFLIWGSLLALGLSIVITKKQRRNFLAPMVRLSWFAPVAYAFNLLMIAILFFSSVTYVLVERRRLVLNDPRGIDVSAEAVRDFYSWHFLEAIPFAKVNETLRWKEPLTYESGWVGLLLLLFQITVILPVVAAFAWFWKERDEDGKAAEKT